MESSSIRIGLSAIGVGRRISDRIKSRIEGNICAASMMILFSKAVSCNLIYLIDVLLLLRLLLPLL